jgi:hypothetical protein
MSPRKKTSIPSQSEYEAREARELETTLSRVEKAPLADRKEAARDYYEVMANDPARVAERIGWLFDGNYGYGAMMKAKRILAAPRMNRAAALSQIVAALDHQCAQRDAMAMWNKLTPRQKQDLDAAIQVVIVAAENDVE